MYLNFGIIKILVINFFFFAEWECTLNGIKNAIYYDCYCEWNIKDKYNLPYFTLSGHKLFDIQ